MRKQASARQADILDVLQDCITPKTAYEILGALKSSEQGRAHRLESLEGFAPCRCDNAESLAVLAICEDCGSVEEHDGSPLIPNLHDIAGQTGFDANRQIVEIYGRCHTCTP